MQEIGAELRIKNAAGEKDQSYKQQDGDKGNEQVRDDQAVAQAPEQPGSPPPDEAHQKIDGRQDRQILEKIRRSPTKTEDFEHHPGDHQEPREKIKPGKAVPNFFQISAERCHRAVNRNNTVPERHKESSGSLGGTENRPDSRAPGLLESQRYCCGALLTRL